MNQYFLETCAKKYFKPKVPFSTPIQNQGGRGTRYNKIAPRNKKPEL